MAKPVGLDVDALIESSLVRIEDSPLQEKNLQFSDSSPHLRPSVARQESLQSNLSPSTLANFHAKELRRQHSLTDAKRQKEDGGKPSAGFRPSSRDGIVDQVERNATAEFGDRELEMTTRGEKSLSLNRQQYNSRNVGMDSSSILRVSNKNQYEYVDRRTTDSPNEQGGKGRIQDWSSSREQVDREDSRQRGTGRSR